MVVSLVLDALPIIPWITHQGFILIKGNIEEKIYLRPLSTGFMFKTIKKTYVYNDYSISN